MKIVGIQDYPMPAPKWLDTTVSVTWLRAFENLADENNDMYAILEEPNYDYIMSNKLNNVKYFFTRSSRRFNESLMRYLKEIKPDIIMYNYCDYASIPNLIRIIRNVLPETQHCIRVHHGLKRVVSNRNLLLSILDLVDAIVVSTKMDLEYIGEVSVNRKYDKKMFIVPFGVDIKYMKYTKNTKFKSIDVVSSSSSNPVKNLETLNKIFNELNKRGYSTRNVLGESKESYRDVLNSSKIFISLSNSEASGSRSLIEAISCGLYPVVNKDCESACEVISKLGGISIDIGSNINDIVEMIEKLINKIPEIDCKEKLELYSEEIEIQKLKDIFYNLVHKVGVCDGSQDILEV